MEDLAKKKLVKEKYFDELTPSRTEKVMVFELAERKWELYLEEEIEAFVKHPIEGGEVEISQNNLTAAPKIDGNDTLLIVDKRLKKVKH